jgi:DNA-binding transcriptional LysR family regulator
MVMPTRAPNWLVSTPMSGAPMGVPPMNASMYSPITRPRIRESVASWTDAFAMDWNANGLIAAVAAGIGISALAASLVPAQLATLGPGHRLPELGTIDLVLLTNPRTG